MKDIAIYGAGGFGREIACLIKKINEKTPTWNFIGFFDDGIEKGFRNEYGEILGGINELNQIKQKISITIAIANPKIISKIVESITSSFVDYPNIIAPDIVCLDENSVYFGKGNIVGLGTRFSCNITIGDFNILNSCVAIGHDVQVGSFNSIMPSVIISGEVHIRDRNFLGVNSIILQQIEIGYETIIGANSLIIRKTKDGNTYFGNPATIINF